MTDTDRQNLVLDIASELSMGQSRPPIELAKAVLDRLERVGYRIYSSPHEVRAAVREMDANAELAGQAPFPTRWR